ncbi:MAG: fatty-acyl-CoA synthase [Planctomycetota bacterium]
MTSKSYAHNLWSVLTTAASEHGTRTAFADFEDALDYRGLLEQATALSTRFLDLGLAPGQRISILADNCPGYLSTYFAAAGAGLVLNPLNVRLTLVELRDIAQHADSRCLLADRAHRELALELVAAANFTTLIWLDDDEPGGVSWEDVLGTPSDSFEPVVVAGDAPAQLYYTSGTTGQPKGVILTHRNVTEHAHNASFELDLCASDVWGHFAPLFHLADAWACFAITMVGGSHIFVPRFSGSAVLQTIESFGVTLTNMVPTMIVRVLTEQEAKTHDLSSLRLMLSGGAPMAPALIRQLAGLIGCEYAQTYGLTETSPYLTISRLGDESNDLNEQDRSLRVARTGRPFRGVELEVVRADGTHILLDDLEVGEVRVRGETVSPGYWQQPEETALAFRNGWFYTGDLACMDAGGWINIVDRKKDVILSGGETVYSTEVENALFEHPDVREAAVFGVPDEEWGERVAAAIVLRSGCSTDAEQLQEFCRERLAGFKTPREFVFLPNLPRTGSGKIRKESLRTKSS